ncbi:kelch repeat-containing protein, partial [Spongiimicrobium sp. 3-5]|uniref:kelch repeat-containing protein n=1 Tax=Spongiimicrobium sp. 3-5 TaxID=3332596 RepID=UPI00397FEF08
MFDIGRILKVGGSRSYDSNTPAKDNSYVIDINVPYGNAPTVTQTSNNLTLERVMHNSTVLPNGEVLVTGGLDHAETFTDVGAALTAELYNPSTNSWRTVAGMVTPRTYHSVAI